jgi:uncharacterized repeat protein (TIGR01451 family)
MSNENGTPRDKKLRYFGLIIAIVAIVVTIILAIWQYSPPPPDFSISINPMQGAVHQGGVITTAVTIKCVHGYEEPVSLSATGQPSGVVLAFVPQSGEAKPSYTSHVTINVNSNVLVGDHKITINGIGADGKEHRCSYTLTVKPSFTPTSTPTPTSTKVLPQLDIIHTTLLEEPQIGEEALVTVSIQNRGDCRAKNITLTESIPSSISVSSVAGASSSSGNLVIWSGELKPGEVHSITHTFKILEEKRIFFPAKATFKDEYGKRYEISTTIYVMAKESTPTPTLTPTSTPHVALTQTLPPTNNPPAAFVDSIKPNPSRQEQPVTFTCHGDDLDSGDDITEYRWESSIDGFLSNQKTFSISSLSLGLHQIILRVKDSHGQWSSEITRNLRVEAIEIPSPEINDRTPESVPSITPTPTPAPAPAPAPTADLGETFTNTVGMEFVTIPAGEFEMGSPSDEEGRKENEGPVHHVNIEKAFHMGKYEVTQKQWRAIMGDNPSWFMGGDSLPVEWVSWNEVQEFIKKLNEKEGTDKYRLPSEAEWEYACRAGTITRYSFGDSESKLGDYAWYSDNSDKKTHPVGQKKPNSWGLYDMHGNVWEWVQDSWHDGYNGAPADGSAWEGDGADRVIRGGCWHDFARSCRSANRVHVGPGLSYRDLGFRLLKEQ